MSSSSLSATGASSVKRDETIERAAMELETSRTETGWSNVWQLCRPFCSLVKEDGTAKTQKDLDDAARSISDEHTRLKEEYVAANKSACDAQDAVNENYRKRHVDASFWPSLSFEEKIAFASKEAADIVRRDHYSQQSREASHRYENVSVRAVAAIRFAIDYRASTTCVGIARRCRAEIELVRDLLKGLEEAKGRWIAHVVSLRGGAEHEFAWSVNGKISIGKMCLVLKLVVRKLSNGTATDLECVQWINALHSSIVHFQLEATLVKADNRNIGTTKVSFFVPLDMAYAAADRKLHQLVDKINTGAEWRFAFGRPCDPPRAVEVRKERVAVLKALLDARAPPQVAPPPEEGEKPLKRSRTSL